MNTEDALIHARVPRAVYDRLKARTKAERRSMAYVVARALPPGLDALDARDEQVARALAIADDQPQAPVVTSG